MLRLFVQCGKSINLNKEMKPRLSCSLSLSYEFVKGKAKVGYANMRNWKFV